jgi:hypothetical protein
MAKRNECLVLLVEDIDHIIHNVIFEYLVLNVYGNSWFHLNIESVAFSYCRANVIDTMGTTTIIINIRGSLIKTHVKFIKNGCFLWLEFFLKGQKKLW